MNISINQPETLSQAHSHQMMVGLYSQDELCSRCAAQAGYGHQHGFSRVHPPCPDCAPIVATFPKPQVNGWRSVEGSATKAANHVAAARADLAERRSRESRRPNFGKG